LKVLIYEPSHTGHHLAYVRLLVQGFSDLGVELRVVLDAEAPASREYQVQLADLGVDYLVDPSVPVPQGSSLRRVWGYVDSLRTTILRHKPDHLLIPYADGISQVIGLHPFPQSVIGGVETEALMMRGSFAYESRTGAERAKSRVTLWALKRTPWRKMYWIDPVPFHLLKEIAPALSRRIQLMPDPVDAPPAISQTDARRRLSLPLDGRFIMATGRLDERKGTDLLIRAFAQATLAKTDRLLLVGELSTGVRKVVAELEATAHLRAKERLIIWDRYVERDEMLLAFNASDLVCAPYPRHIGSASIVIRAAAAHRPVLGSQFGWMAEMIPRFGLGWICDPTNVGQLAKAISRTMELLPSFSVTESLRRFVEFHSVANFQATWTERIRERLGLQPSPRQRSWQWVNSSAED